MSTLARKGSKMEKALQIFEDNLGKADRRQLCIQAFMSELDQVKSTAETYYNLCVQKLDKAQQKETDKVIQSTQKRKFSAVKIKPGTNTASKVHCFLTKKAAEQYNEQHGFDQVVKGVQKLGKEVGTVAA